MPVGRVVGTTDVALGNTNRAAIGANSTRPRQPPHEFLREQQLAVGAIEDVEEAVPVRMQKELARLPAIGRVDEDIRLLRIPIANIVRRELVVPLEFSRGGIQREDTVGEQIVAAALAIIGIRPRIAGSPVEGIGLGIIRACLPRRTSARCDGRSLPGLEPRIAFGRNGPVAPHAFASRRPRRRRSPCR